MKITEKNLTVKFDKIKEGEIFKIDGYFLMKIKELRGYDDSSDMELWANAIYLGNGETTAFLEDDEVESVEKYEFLVY